MSIEEFDIVAHHRQRARKAEQRADGLERHRDQLERILCLALHVAAGQDCDPLTLLAVLEELDRRMGEPYSIATIDELAQLLRDTDPSSFPPSTEGPKQETTVAA